MYEPVLYYATASTEVDWFYFHEILPSCLLQHCGLRNWILLR